MTPVLTEAAMSLVGTAFRLHGRSPASGLDCVGLVAEAMRRAGYVPVVPEGYSLRSTDVARWSDYAGMSNLVPVAHAGDVVLCKVNPLQSHLLVSVTGGFVHAHAGLGRVTYLPGTLPWPTVMQWRLSPKET